MKLRILFALFLSLAVAMPPQALASDALALQVQNLVSEMAKMRETYESRMTEMQSEINQLKKARVAPPDAGAAEGSGKRVDVEYVPRHEGPFEKGGLVMREHSGFGTVSVGGYMDHEFENFSGSNSTFDQHRWVLNIGAELGERLRFYSEYEIEHGGPNANNTGDGEAKVEQAWVDFLIHEAVNVRAGALLVPFGRYNLYHDSDLQDLTDRPLVARDIIPTTWTEAGAGFWGEFFPTVGDMDMEIGYEAYAINGLDAGFSDTGLRGGRGSLSSDNNNGKAFVGRLVVSPAIGHEVGLSGYWGEYNGERDDITGVGVDFLTTWGPWEFLGEYAFFDIDDTDGGNRVGLAANRDVAEHMQGFYIQSNYHFWFDFLDDTFLGRTFDNPTFTLVGRFGMADIDDDADGVPAGALTDNVERRWTLGVNYRPVESWVLKLEYQNNSTRAERLERGDGEGFLASVAMGF